MTATNRTCPVFPFGDDSDHSPDCIPCATGDHQGCDGIFCECC